MALEVRIEKQFERFKLNVDFETAGGITGLLGASGCGKSLTLKCVAGIVTPDRGRIVLDGRVLFDSEKRVNLPPQKRRVGYLFQSYALFPNMTVAQNIAAGVRDRAERESAVQNLIRAFYLEGQEGKFPRQLSGGQQQRVSLARILASGPEALLLDEPFTALDSYLRWQVELELRDRLAAFPGPVVFVTHSRNEAYRLCREVCVLDRGQSEPRLPVGELFDRPRTLSACLLTGCKNISRARPAGENRVEALDWGVILETGRPVSREMTHIGVRSHYLSPRAVAGENNLPCRVERVVEDVFSTVVLLSAGDGKGDASRLRLELDKGAWADLGNPKQLTVGIRPQDIMLLTSSPYD